MLKARYEGSVRYQGLNNLIVIPVLLSFNCIFYSSVPPPIELYCVRC